ncbi:NAD-dependent epimerase [Planococcus lenghuensis]|uniref:NAD-dependent epimerase/dehydratase domain-containing protein n=1 Tax=Planococcus lenghuensis TaxID=2213202 RepID=A0A1Q2L4Y4_9BACL|nr:NAD-dependent epimerase [Planococcus lenghuensis]AQQ55147.1 hypothetical protein B0X71_14720 [Planococcus lenghuensis]
MKVLVTGAAGFIGYSMSEKLLNSGHEVVGIDNINDYYDVHLKEARLEKLTAHKDFSFIELDLENGAELSRILKQTGIKKVIHLAAQAGVRYSLENPQAYINSNINGFLNVLEACRRHKIDHLIYASSSSVYGANRQLPFSVHDNVDHPLSLYAATKKANELMAHTYSSLYGLPTTGLRFFTVYGPWGRPDMALFKFTKSILEEEPIEIYNNGNMLRDFTYIDDITESIFRLLHKPAESNPKWDGMQPDPGTSYAPYKVYNIGNNNPVNLMEFIHAIEEATGKTAIKQFLPLQAGDVPETYADVEDLYRDINFRPSTEIRTGIRKFIEWYTDYYELRNLSCDKQNEVKLSEKS